MRLIESPRAVWRPLNHGMNFFSSPYGHMNLCFMSAYVKSEEFWGYNTYVDVYVCRQWMLGVFA